MHPHNFRGNEKTLHLVMHSWSSVYESMDGVGGQFIREIERRLELGVRKSVYKGFEGEHHVTRIANACGNPSGRPSHSDVRRIVSSQFLDEEFARVHRQSVATRSLASWARARRGLSRPVVGYASLR